MRNGYGWRRGYVGAALLVAAIPLAGCPDNETTPVPDEFARVEVQEVLGVSGGPRVWVVGLDLINREGNGQYLVQFRAPDDCLSVSAQIFVTAGRDWEDSFTVDCREQPREVAMFSLRINGFQVTDRDSIPLVVQNP